MKLQFSESIKPLLFASYGITLLLVAIASAGFLFLQPEIPLQYTLPRPDQQLSPKSWIFVFPLISLTINGIHTLLIGMESRQDSLLLVLFARVSLIIQLVLLLAVLRIVYITL